MSEFDRPPDFAQYGALRAELHRFLGGRIGNQADADDLAQDTFVRWLDSAGSAPMQQARPLLFRIARNLMVDHWRRQQVRAGKGLIELDEHAAEQDDALQTEGPLVMIEQQQRLYLLAEALKDLPPKRKQAFTLHKFDGLSQAAVAQQMGISLSMVEKHIALAMLHCKRYAQTRLRQRGY